MEGRLLLAIEGYRLSDYWLYVATSATSADLDNFHIPASPHPHIPASPRARGDARAYHRAVWVGCCGHPSEFQARGVHYGSPGLEGMAERAMSSRFGRAVAPGDRFQYRYDFGTTTELALRAVMAVDSPRGRPPCAAACAQRPARDRARCLRPARDRGVCRVPP